MFDALTDWHKAAFAGLVGLPAVVYALVQGVHPFWALIAGAEVMFLVLCLIIIKEQRGYVFRVMDNPHNDSG